MLSHPLTLVFALKAVFISFGALLIIWGLVKADPGNPFEWVSRTGFGCLAVLAGGSAHTWVPSSIANWSGPATISLALWAVLPLSIAGAVHLVHRSHIWWLRERERTRLGYPKSFLDIDMQAQARRRGGE